MRDARIPLLEIPACGLIGYILLRMPVYLLRASGCKDSGAAVGGCFTLLIALSAYQGWLHDGKDIFFKKMLNLEIILVLLKSLCVYNYSCRDGKWQKENPFPDNSQEL